MDKILHIVLKLENVEYGTSIIFILSFSVNTIILLKESIIKISPYIIIK